MHEFGKRFAAFWAPMHSTLVRSKGNVNTWKFESQVFHGALIASLSTFPLLGAEVSGSCQIRLMTGDDLDALVSVENVCFVQPYSREPGQKNTSVRMEFF